MNDLTKKDYQNNDWAEETFKPWMLAVSIVIIFAAVGTIETWGL